MKTRRRATARGCWWIGSGRAVLPKRPRSLSLWLREVAPSAALRRWFGHDPERFEAFRARYEEELASNHEAVAQLRALLSAGRLTLLYGARDEAHNQAVVLADYLRKEPGEGEEMACALPSGMAASQYHCGDVGAYDARLGRMRFFRSAAILL